MGPARLVGFYPLGAGMSRFFSLEEGFDPIAEIGGQPLDGANLLATFATTSPRWIFSIPSSHFIMGSPLWKRIRFCDESPQHEALIARQLFYAKERNSPGPMANGHRKQSLSLLPARGLSGRKHLVGSDPGNPAQAQPVDGNTRISLPSEGEKGGRRYAGRAGGQGIYRFGNDLEELGR